MSVRKDGSIGSLFINRRERLKMNVWMKSGTYPKKGFKVRSGWHSTEKPIAPHLSLRGRSWFKVKIENYTTILRPASQGNKWFLSKKIKILKKI